MACRCGATKKRSGGADPWTAGMPYAYTGQLSASPNAKYMSAVVFYYICACTIEYHMRIFVWLYCLLWKRYSSETFYHVLTSRKWGEKSIIQLCFLNCFCQKLGLHVSLLFEDVIAKSSWLCFPRTENTNAIFISFYPRILDAEAAAPRVRLSPPVLGLRPVRRDILTSHSYGKGLN